MLKPQQPLVINPPLHSYLILIYSFNRSSPTVKPSMERPQFMIPLTWSKNNVSGKDKNKSTVDKKATPGILWRSLRSTQEDKQEIEGCSLQEKLENLTSEVAASTSTIDGQRLEEIIKGLGMHSFFSTPAMEASTTTMEDEGYSRRLVEITSLVIHEGRRLRLEEIVNELGMHPLCSTSTMAASTSTMAASTSTMADVQKEINRWSFLEEISEPFNNSLKSRFSEFEEYALISSSTKKEHGDYTCENVLSIWPKLRKEHRRRRGRRDVGEELKGPRDVGEEIKKNLPKSDMIEEETFIHDVGFVTFSLSRKWITKSIHKMLKDGIDTWAPELPVERVIVDYPSLEEEVHVDFFRRRAIGNALIRMLEYSKVAATIGPTQDIVASFFHRYSERDEICHWAREVFNKCFSKKQRKGNVVIKGKPPFILAKRDFDNAYKDLLALWYGRCVHKADWIIYVTPLRQQEYIKMCMTAATLEKWIPSDGHKPPRTSYAGYRTCTTELSDNLLHQAKALSEWFAQADEAEFLGYSAEALLDCSFTYAFLKRNRLSALTFNCDEMFDREGNTFLYLLNSLATVLTITDLHRGDIDELKKAPKLILEEKANWRTSEERVLEFHLLYFTEDLKDSCLFVLPNILCGYLYDLAVKFNDYACSVYKVVPLKELDETSLKPFLLLCEATALVMKKCFHLLGLTPKSSFFDLSLAQLPPGLLLSANRPMDINVRYPPRNSRFELFSVLPSIITGTLKEGNLFGLIAVSDNYGILSDEGVYLSEPDFSYVTLFKRDWCDPLEMIDCEIVYLGNPSSRHSVPLSSSIEIQMRLFATATKKKDKCFQLCKDLIELDISDFWDEKSDCQCGYLAVKGEDGMTDVHYVLLKDAVDTDIEITFKTKSSDGLKVCGNIFASYGDGFPYADDRLMASYYRALLYHAKSHEHLKNDVRISLWRSMLAVPLKGSLVIQAYLEEVDSGKVIIDGSWTVKSQRDDFSLGVIEGTEGTNCSLDLKVNWKYQPPCP